MSGARRIVAVVLVLASLGPACNSRLIRPPATVYVDGGESSVSALVDGEQMFFPAVLTSFFPSTVPLHPGDGVRFDMRYNGEPHTVALGTLIDAATAEIVRLGSTAGVTAVERTEALQKIPSVLPPEPGAEPLVNRSAAEPCFLDSGEPAVSATGGAEACPRREQPDFDGTQSFYSSGLLPEGEGFRMKLASDIPPGTYSFMCLVHRSYMHGSIEVRERSAERPNVLEVKRTGSNEQGVVAATVATAGRDAASGAAPGVVRAGAGPSGEVRGFVAGFVPDLVEVGTGETVRWDFYAMHTVSFQPERRARDGILLRDGDGRVTVNEKAWPAVDGPDPPPAARSYLPVRDNIVIDGGTYAGDGAKSSGIVRATPPASVSYTLRFDEPGSYDYVCLVHDGMRGRVVVT